MLATQMKPELAGFGTAKLREGPANPELAARLMAGRVRRGVSRPPALRLLLQAEQALDTVLPAERSTGSAGSMRERWQARPPEALGQLARARQQAGPDIATGRSGVAFGQLVLARGADRGARPR